MAVRIAAIGVGGRGIRLGRNDIQKCLFPLDGKPIMEYVIDAFEEAGASLITLLSGFLHEQAAAYLAHTAPRSHTLALVYGGTDGEDPAICRMTHFLDEEFIYAGGDCIISPSAICTFAAYGDTRKNDAAIVAVNPHTHIAPTHARFLLEGDSVRNVVDTENPAAAPYVTMGMYLIRPKAFRYLQQVPPGRPASAFIAHALKAGETISACFIDEPWFCIHTPEDIARWTESPIRQNRH